MIIGLESAFSSMLCYFSNNPLQIKKSQVACFYSKMFVTFHRLIVNLFNVQINRRQLNSHICFFHLFCCNMLFELRQRKNRIDAFKLWCWKRLLRILWTARRSNQSILKKINFKYSWEALLLNLEAPILWPPDAKSQRIGKDPDAGKD